MIPIINAQNLTEFELYLRRKFIYSPSAKISQISIFDDKLNDSLEVKLFIKDIYYKYYKAHIEITYPQLISLLDKNNNILSAAGFRSADNTTLFLEQYLDDKIENILSAKYKKNIARSQIVEVGSLASNGSGMAKFLFIAIAAYLRQKGYLYTVMTGTSNLRKSFYKLNLKPSILCEANQDKLLHKDEDWGKYYDTQPKVMACDINRGYKTLKVILGASIIPSITKLYPYE